MTIDEAIKILDPATTAAELAKLETYGKLIGTQAAIKATEDACLIAVEIMKRSRWTPCSERTPETSGDYLVCTKNDYYGTQNVAKRYFFKDLNRWKCGWTNITHWRHLPEPPEEGGSGNEVD